MKKFLLLYTHTGYIFINITLNNILTIKFQEVIIMAIKVYSTPSCPWCTVAKNYLTSKHVQFEDVDVSRNREAATEMIQKSGQRGVPVIDIDGNIIVGFDQASIDSCLRS
jgi:glutaredoxin-like YruB-family protein